MYTIQFIHVYMYTHIYIKVQIGLLSYINRCRERSRVRQCTQQVFEDSFKLMLQFLMI